MVESDGGLKGLLGLGYCSEMKGDKWKTCLCRFMKKIVDILKREGDWP